MRISFLIPAIVFYVVSVSFSDSVHVGTVLFTAADLIKRCWTESDKSLLKARLIMQDVLPDPDCIDFSNPNAAHVLLDYFHTCFQIIGRSTYGKIQNLMFVALSDALGGYLRTFVLPFTKRAYYAGQIKYSEAKSLFKLYDDIKVYLKTNGVGWAEPQKLSLKNFRAKPLHIIGGNAEACRALYMIEKEGKLHYINPKCVLHSADPTFNAVRKNEKFREGNLENVYENPKSGFANSSRNDKEKLKEEVESEKSQEILESFVKGICSNNTNILEKENKTEKHKRSGQENCGSGPVKRVIVPLPILDDNIKPHSIAIPFRKRPLRNLHSRVSAFVLMYYYTAVIKCFLAKGSTRSDLRNFNAQFHSWLESQVMPRLLDEHWYPGFGGVLRVMETIKKYGMERIVTDPLTHDVSYLFGPGVEFEVEGNMRGAVKDKTREVADAIGGDDLSTKRHVITAIIIASIIWLFVFCACAFYCQATRGRLTMYNDQQPSHRSLMEQKSPDRYINFHFLIKFFKQKMNKPTEEALEENDETSIHFAYVGNDPEMNSLSENCGPVNEIPPPEPERKKKRQKLTICGQGDFPSFKLPKMEVPIKSGFLPWSLTSSLASLEKTFHPLLKEGGDGKVRNDQSLEGKTEVQMLWKKPSTKFKRNASIKDETKYYSTEKLSSSCSCTDTCRHSSQTTLSPTSTSRTEVEEKMSSATMEFFENVIRRKTRKKCSTKASTEESESELGGSSSSETDKSTKMTSCVYCTPGIPHVNNFDRSSTIAVATTETATTVNPPSRDTDKAIK